MSDREESIEQIDNENGDDNSSSHDERSMTPRDDDSENDSPHSANGHSPRPAGRSRSRSRSRSKSKRYRKSRSRSISHEKSRKYSKYSSPDHHRSHRSKRSRSPMSSRRRHVGNRDNPPSGRCLGIFGLSIYTQERDLKNVFSKYGPIEDVQIVYDAQTGRSRGFAFVYFENRNHAYDAKERCNGMEIDGRKIRVDFSITQRAHTPTPGIYMGKPTHPRYRSSDRNSSYRGSTSSSYNHRVSSSYYANNHNDSSYSRHHHRRSPSPYYSSSSKDYRRGGGGGGRYSRSRSRSISPRSKSYHYRSRY